MSAEVAQSLASDDASKLGKAENKGSRGGHRPLRGANTMPQSSTKVLADEEMARRLHEELNGPEVSPAATATRRNRKAPTFYTPPGPGSVQGTQGGDGSGPSDDELGGLSKPLDFPRLGVTTEEERAKPEMAGSSGGKRPGKRSQQAMENDSAEGSPPPCVRGRPSKRQKGDAEADISESSAKTGRRTRMQTEKDMMEVGHSQARSSIRKQHQNGDGLQLIDSASDFAAATDPVMGTSTDRSRPAEAHGGAPFPRSSLTEDAISVDKRSFSRATRSAGDANSEEPPNANAGPVSRLVESGPALGMSIASSSHNSGQDPEDASLDGTVEKTSYRKVPKLPMCRQGQIWYRARKVSETKTKVLLEFPGVVNTQAIWLAKDSPRIWTGSYKGKDWKHLGDGAWEPKIKEEHQVKRPGPGRGRKRKTHEDAQPTNNTSDDEEISDDDEIKPDAPAESRPASSNVARPKAWPDQEAVDAVTAVAKLQDTKDEAAYAGEAVPVKTTGRRGRPPGSKRGSEVPATRLQDQQETGADESEAAPQADRLQAQQGNCTAEGAAAAVDTPTALETNQTAAEDGISTEGRRGRPAKRSKKATAAACGGGLHHRLADKREAASSEGIDIDYQPGPPVGSAITVQGAAEPKRVLTAVAKLTTEAELPAEGLGAALLSAADLTGSQTDAQPSKSRSDGKSEQKAGMLEPAQQSGHTIPKVPGSGLGALAQALADANACKLGQQAPKADAPPPAAPKSARNRKRAAVKAARAAMESGAASPSGHSNAATDTGKGNGNGNERSLSSQGKSEDEGKKPCTSAPHDQTEAWKGAWKLKHKQKLEEVEAEEEAAESQEELSEGAQEPMPEQPAQRPLRAIRAPRFSQMERSDLLHTRSSRDTETGSPPTPVRRAGRGRGRWANHIKRGSGRGLRPMPSPSPQDTPRASKPSGRGRRGGRWGNRPPRMEHCEDMCMSAFGGLVNALDSKAAGLPFAGFPTSSQGYEEGPPLCHRILDVSPEQFVRAGLMSCAEVKEFRMPPPPVPLFKVTA